MVAGQCITTDMNLCRELYARQNILPRAYFIVKSDKQADLHAKKLKWKIGRKRTQASDEPFSCNAKTHSMTRCRL